jgi:hypothetical protein
MWLGTQNGFKSIADLQVLHEILAKIEMNPDVGQIDQGNQRYAGRYIFARLDIALIDLRGNGGIDNELIDDRLNALDIGIGLFDAGSGNGPLLFGVAIDRLLVGRFGLIDGAFAFVQRISRLVEACLRRVALLGQCMSAIKGLLRQHQPRLRTLHFRFSGSNGLHPRSDKHVGELRIGNSHRRSHLVELGNSFRIVDSYEHRVRSNVLPTFDRDFFDPPVNTRGNIEACCIGLALYEQWFRP